MILPVFVTETLCPFFASNRNKDPDDNFGYSRNKNTYYKETRMKSSWGVEFAFLCDKNNIKWEYEPKTFDLGNTTYTPDFYLPEFNLYIEIKGFWRDDAKVKFEEFKQKYCGIRIKVIDKIELMKERII